MVRGKDHRYRGSPAHVDHFVNFMACGVHTHGQITAQGHVVDPYQFRGALCGQRIGPGTDSGRCVKVPIQDKTEVLTIYPYTGLIVRVRARAHKDIYGRSRYPDYRIGRSNGKEVGKAGSGEIREGNPSIIRRRIIEGHGHAGHGTNRRILDTGLQKPKIKA